MYLPRTGDLVIYLTTLIGQGILARLYFRHRRQLPAPRLILSALIVLWTCCLIDTVSQLASLAFGLHVGRWIAAPVRGVIYSLGTTWSLTSATSMVLYFTFRRLSPEPRRFSPERRRLLSAAGVAAATPFAAVAFGGIVERTKFQVKEIDLPVPNLHPDLEGFRIVQLSDLHVSPFLSVPDAGRVVDMANELRANLAVVTGDLISEAGDPLDETILELARLRSDTGILGCLGNHEYYARCQRYATAQAARRGIGFLRHEARTVRWGAGLLNVAGVDYQNSQNKPAYLRDAESLIVPGMTNLLLSHNPDVFPIAVRQGYDAVLAGHTHGGQVTIEILNQTANFARFFTRYVSGLYRIDGRSCYVTPGIGTIGMPVRLGVRPEISLLRLRKA